MKSQTRLTQRSRVDQRPAPSLLPVVHEMLHSPGQPLDPSTRAFMEPRFGHDFSQVRVHTDTPAAESARAVKALAYTVGRNVVFAAGQYAPGTAQGQRLLAHELTHVAQQNHLAGRPPVNLSIGQRTDAGEAEAEAGVERIEAGKAAPPITRLAVATLQRQEGEAAQAKTPAKGPMSRARFDQIMKDRYRVTHIRNGTFQDQSLPGLNQQDWKPWDDSASPQIYEWIVDAFANFEKSFGGLPAVKEIVFFETRYTRNAQDQVIKDTDTGASYALGQLTIYRGIQQGNQMFDVHGKLTSPTTEQAVKRNIVHELGHGVAETALNQRTNEPPGADPDLLKDYRRAVGWTQEEKLYDIQEPAVQTALANNTPPPAQFQITPANALTKPWKERPLTAYITDNPGDDFAEAITAYVNESQRLKALSPTRYDFIDRRKARWLASGQPKINIWEQVKRGGPARTLKPSQPPTIWERAAQGK